MDATQYLDEIFIEELNLSPDTFISLSNAGFFTVGKLKKLLQSNKLKQIYNVGPKSEEEISTALRNLYKTPPDNMQVENKLDDYIDSSELDEILIEEINLSRRIIHSLRRCGVLTAGELKKLLQTKKIEQIKNIGPKSLDEIYIALNDLYKTASDYIKIDSGDEVEHASQMPIEKIQFESEKRKANWSEVVQSFFESEKDTYTFIMLSRCGVKPKSLEEIASELGVTRERVRKIQVAEALRFLNYMKHETSSIELLGKVSEILSFNGGDLSLTKFREMLIKDAILGEFSPSFVPERISKVDPFEALICWLTLLSNSKYSLEPVVFPIDINALINFKIISSNEINTDEFSVAIKELSENRISSPDKIFTQIQNGIRTIGDSRFPNYGMLLNITDIGQKGLVEIHQILESIVDQLTKFDLNNSIEDKQRLSQYPNATTTWAEIIQSYFESEKDNYTYILLARFGFKPKKLEEIASELNVTRERVRQVQEAATIRFLKYIRFSNSVLFIERIHEILGDHGENLSLRKFKGLLKKENLLGEFSQTLMSDRISKIDLFETLICWLNLLSDSKHTQPPVEFPVDIKALLNSESISIKDSEKLQSISPKLKRKIKRKVHFTGGINIIEASKVLSEDEHTTEMVLRKLNLKKIEEHWYSLETYDADNDTSKIPLWTAGMKMLTVKPDIHLDTFYDGLRRYANRFYSSIAPINVVAHALKLLGFEINDQKIVSTKLIAKNILSRSEKSLVSAISKNKGIASFLEIAEEFFLQGLSLPAVSVTLKRSPIAEKVDDGFYKLRGVEISWQQIDIAKNRQKRYSQDEEISHGLDGIVRVRITINNYAYLTGVVGSHSIKGMTGSWSVIYNNESFGEAKMDETYLWGLPKLFKKLGVQMGDRIELAFNTWDRTLSVGKVNHGST